MATRHQRAAYPRRVARQPAAAYPATAYTERLRAPWWPWLCSLALAALLSAEVFLGAPGLLTWIPYLVLPPLTVLGLLWAGRIRVAVEDGEFRVDDARLPVRFISQVGVLSVEAKRDALGPRADPYAFVVQRPWLREAVLVVLDDPADPTPYWVVSSRRPTRLAAALQAAVHQHRPPAAGQVGRGDPGQARRSPASPPPAQSTSG